MIAILVAISATVFIWPKVVADPGLTLLGANGDATKNYYTYLYQSLYGDGVWFRGMNYPYGEHIVYTDGQPILSVPLSYLQQYIAFDRQALLMVMHLAMLAAFALGIVYLYKTLVHFKVPPGLAIVGSVLIQAFSPQVFKFFAHYGLSYACVVPMLLYWSVKLYETGGVKYAVYVFILGIVMNFFHPYLAAIVLMWGLFYAVAVLVMQRKQKLKAAVSMLLAVMMIAVFVRGVMLATDPVNDRPDYPSGILSYCTTGHDLFTSPYSPVSLLFADKDDRAIMSTGGEGYAYIGIAAWVLVICGLVMIARARKKKIINQPALPGAFILLAVFALLLSMGVPFVWGMEWLIDYVSAFRQFRTLGRFSWIWYYIMSVFAIIVLSTLYHSYITSNKKLTAYTIVLLPLLVWGIEANGHRSYVAERCKAAWINYAFLFSHSEPDWSRQLRSYGYKSSDFQAILSLPYYHLGSDKLWQFYDELETLHLLTCKASLQLGLPCVNAFMARSSWSQTFAQLKIQGGPYAERSLLETTDERPFLVFVKAGDSLTDPDQRYILEAGEYIGEKENDLKAYKLDPSVLREKDSMYRLEARNRIRMSAVGDTAYNIPNNGFWYINHFDSCHEVNSFWSKACLPYKKDEYQIAAEIQVPVADTSRLYEFSAWVLLDSVDYRSPYFDVECYGPSGELAKHQVFVYRAQDTKGMWVRASKYVPIPAGCNRIRCVLFNRTKDTYISADELMLRPAESIIISKEEKGKALANNHVFMW